MRLGLVRHFKVLQKLPMGIWTLVSQEQVLQWFNEYDKADIEKSTTDLGGVLWDVCFTSDLERAKKTAAAIFKGNIIVKEDLREFKWYPMFQRNVKLPFIVWPALIRIGWYLNFKSQRHHKSEALQKVKDFVDELLDSDWKNILIVSHAALMMYLRKELLRTGFRGPHFRKARNGMLYLYQI